MKKTIIVDGSTVDVPIVKIDSEFSMYYDPNKKKEIVLKNNREIIQMEADEKIAIMNKYFFRIYSNATGHISYYNQKTMKVVFTSNIYDNIIYKLICSINGKLYFQKYRAIKSGFYGDFEKVSIVEVSDQKTIDYQLYSEITIIGDKAMITYYEGKHYFFKINDKIIDCSASSRVDIILNGYLIKTENVITYYDLDGNYINSFDEKKVHQVNKKVLCFEKDNELYVYSKDGLKKYKRYIYTRDLSLAYGNNYFIIISKFGTRRKDMKELVENENIELKKK